MFSKLKNLLCDSSRISSRIADDLNDRFSSVATNVFNNPSNSSESENTSMRKSSRNQRKNSSISNNNNHQIPGNSDGAYTNICIRCGDINERKKKCEKCKNTYCESSCFMSPKRGTISSSLSSISPANGICAACHLLHDLSYDSKETDVQDDSLSKNDVLLKIFSIKELRLYLINKKVDISDCKEKLDLVKMVLDDVQANRRHEGKKSTNEFPINYTSSHDRRHDWINRLSTSESCQDLSLTTTVTNAEKVDDSCSDEIQSTTKSGISDRRSKSHFNLTKENDEKVKQFKSNLSQETFKKSTENIPSENIVPGAYHPSSIILTNSDVMNINHEQESDNESFERKNERKENFNSKQSLYMSTSVDADDEHPNDIQILSEGQSSTKRRSSKSSKDDLSKCEQKSDDEPKTKATSSSSSGMSHIRNTLYSNVRPPRSPSPSKFPNSRVSLDEITDISEIDELSVRQLKEILALQRVNMSGMLERDDLNIAVQRVWKQQKKFKQMQESSMTIDDDLCKICLENMCDCVMLECGHVCTCIDCGKQMSECPICRQYVVRVVKIFKS